MFNIIDKFRKRDLIGMDIGSHGIKFVRIKSGHIFHGYYQGGIPESGRERTISLIREFLKTHAFFGGQVACNISEDLLKIHKVEVPRMPEADLKEAVRWLIRDAVEGPVVNYVIRHSVVEELQGSEAKKLSLLVYTLPKEAIKAQTDLLKSLSLHLVLVEPAAVSLVALFDRLYPWNEGEFYGAVDFGESKSVFQVMGDGKLYFSRLLPEISGKKLRESSENEFLTQMAVEIQRSIDAFSVNFRREGIRRLFLCGGGASREGLTEYLSKNLAVPTSILDPSEKFPIAAKPAHLYDIALGLALYGN